MWIIFRVFNALSDLALICVCMEIVDYFEADLGNRYPQNYLKIISSSTCSHLQPLAGYKRDGNFLSLFHSSEDVQRLNINLSLQWSNRRILKIDKFWPDFHRITSVEDPHVCLHILVSSLTFDKKYTRTPDIFFWHETKEVADANLLAKSCNPTKEWSTVKWLCLIYISW